MRVKHFIAVTLVTALLFISFICPVSAVSAKGRYGGGGFNPPISDTNVVKSNIIFVPYGVASNGIYKGKYFTFDENVNVRVIYRSNADNTYDVGLQVWRSTSGSIPVGQSKTIVNWHSSTQTFNFTAFSTILKSGKYGTYIPLYNCTSDDFIFNSDFTFATYVVDEYFYNESVLTANAPFYPADSQAGQVYHIPSPLVSNESNWSYNYGYETEQERQEAIEQSRYDEQNKIIQEGFTQVIKSINDSNIALIEAQHENIDRILNAGSDSPPLNTEQNGLTEVISNLNNWVSQLGEFEKQMSENEVENSENMAQAKTFINGFFGVVPKALIACFSLFLVMVVVVKLVGR